MATYEGEYCVYAEIFGIKDGKGYHGSGYFEVGEFDGSEGREKQPDSKFQGSFVEFWSVPT